MRDEFIPLAIFTDESSIACLAGFWGYHGVELGRPTMLVVPAGLDLAGRCHAWNIRSDHVKPGHTSANRCL